MIISLSGEVNKDMLEDLVDAYSDRKKEDEKLVAYFTSEGGDMDAMEAMIDFVNNHKDLVELVFYGEVFSAGMAFFLESSCPKRILPETRGMFHFCMQELTITEGGRPSAGYDAFSAKEMKKAKLRTMESIKGKGLTDKEIREINKGKDVYFSYERMLELLNGTR
jgi:ATP-dependent protease ClpP protease subunit